MHRGIVAHLQRCRGVPIEGSEVEDGASPPVVVVAVVTAIEGTELRITRSYS